jgi:hypothetical protein
MAGRRHAAASVRLHPDSECKSFDVSHPTTLLHRADDGADLVQPAVVDHQAVSAVPIG